MLSALIYIQLQRYIFSCCYQLLFFAICIRLGRRRSPKGRGCRSRRWMRTPAVKSERQTDKRGSENFRVRMAPAATGLNKGCSGCEVITGLPFISESFRVWGMSWSGETVVSANQLSVRVGSIFFLLFFLFCGRFVSVTWLYFTVEVGR